MSLRNRTLHAQEIVFKHFPSNNNNKKLNWTFNPGDFRKSTAKMTAIIHRSSKCQKLLGETAQKMKENKIRK